MLLAKLKRINPDHILLFGCILLAGGISFSRALLSLGEGLIVISGLIRIPNWDKATLKNSYWIVLGYMFLLGLISYFTSQDLIVWERKLIMKLPMILLPIGMLFSYRFSLKQFFYLLLVYAVSVCIIALGTTVNYFLHYEEINALIIQSRAIEVMGGINHIYFSIFNSFSILALGYVYFNFNRFKVGGELKTVVLIVGLLNLICLHILSARTGLVGFYFSLFLLGILLVVKYKKLKLALIGGAVAVILLTGAYLTVGSFKNRVENTVTDFKITYNNENPNFRSFAMRFEAWKTAVHIIKDNGAYGVGMGDVEAEMQERYETDRTLLVLENRIPPHNQFLNDGVAYGVLGIALLLLLFALPFGGQKLIAHPVFLAFWGIVLMGFMFESVLERQRGVAFVAFFLFFIQGFIKAEQEQVK